MTIIGCLFYITLGVFLGFVFWLVEDIKEAVESKLKTATTKTATTTKTTVTTTRNARNREYYVHGGIVYDPNGNPI
jgi:hypothetical protein